MLFRKRMFAKREKKKGDLKMNELAVEQILRELIKFIEENNSSKEEMAEKLGIPYNTLEKWFSLGKRKRPPSIKNIEKIKIFFQFQKAQKEIKDSNFSFNEAQRKTEKIKQFLLFLEEELTWFRRGRKEDRDVFRASLDPNDIGYISSLLGMLGEEDEFQRWCLFTSNKFNYFRRKGVKK